MNRLKNIRELLSLSRQELAQWLGISFETEEKYEQGHADLPVHAKAQLIRLEGMIIHFERGLAATGNTLHYDGLLDNMIPPKHKRLYQCIREAAFLQQQLVLLRARSASLAQQLATVTQCIKDPSADKSEKELRWLKTVNWQLTALLSKCSDQQQYLLKGKRQRLQMALEMMKK